MNIISWNINGIRSSEQSLLDFIAGKQPDILMLQEVRCRPHEISFFLSCIPGYKVVFNCCERPGYSGTAIYYKEDIQIDEIKAGHEDPVLNTEARIIQMKIGNVFLLNVYTPNGTSSEERLKFKLDFYEKFYLYIRELINKGYSVIVGGDLNVAHTELDLFSPESNARNSGFLPAERKWFDKMLDLGLVDTYRLFHLEGGNYSWWHMRDPKRAENKGWRFDYFLVSESMKQSLIEAYILREVFGSDHCPVGIDIKFQISRPKFQKD